MEASERAHCFTYRIDIERTGKGKVNRSGVRGQGSQGGVSDMAMAAPLATLCTKVLLEPKERMGASSLFFFNTVYVYVSHRIASTPKRKKGVNWSRLVFL